MAYADPQTVSASPLSRVMTGTTVGEFVSADNNAVLTIDPRPTKRRRRNAARYYIKKDVTTGGVTYQDQFMVSITIDRPKSGITDAEVEAAYDALIAWAGASSKAAIKKLIAGEN